jgi:hypothetical protein
MTSLTTYDSTVYIQSSINIWFTTFYFQMHCDCSCSCCCIGDYAKFKYNNADILNIGGGYNNTETDYSSTKIVDINSDAVSKFIVELSKHIFGSDQTVSFISNNSLLINNIQNTIVASAVNINESIDDNGSIYIADTSSANIGYKTSSSIYYNIYNNTDRLKIYYNFLPTIPLPASSTICDLEDSVNNADIKITTDSNGEIIELNICCSGSNYTKGDSVTFTDGVYSITSSSITSLQAAGFNGTTKSGDIELPLEVGDIINIAQIITSSAEQLNPDGELITAQQIVRFSIKLV